MVLYIDFDARQRLAAAAEDDALQLTRLAAVEAGQRFLKLESTIDGIVLANPGVLSNPSGCAAARDLLAPGDPAVAGYYLLDSSGGITCVSSSGLVTPEEVNSLFQQVVRTGQPLAGGLRQATGSGGVIDILVPLTDGASTWIAGLVYDAGALREIGQTVPIPPGSVLLLVDLTGTILTRLPDPQAWVGQKVPDAGLIREILLRSSGTTRLAGLDGVERIYAFTTVESSNSIFASIGIPVDVVFASANRMYRLNLILLGLVSSAALVITWVVGRNVILEPVHTLAAASQRLASGDLTSRTGLHGDTEFGQLGRYFDEMAAALEDRSSRLLEAEQYFRTLLETSPVSILVFDNSGRISFANHQASELLEVPNPELAGYGAGDPRWTVLDMAGKTVDRGALFAEILNSAEPSRNMGSYYLLDHTGNKHLISVKTTQILDKTGKTDGVMVVLDDFTELTQRQAELEAVTSLAYALRNANSVNEIAVITLDVAAKILQADGAMLAVSQTESGDLLFLAGTGAWKDVNGKVLPSGEGVSAEVIATGKPYLHNDINSDPRLYFPLFGGEIKAGLCVPLTNRDKTIGVVWAGRNTPFTSEDSRLLSGMADIAANAILRTTLFDQTRLNLEELSALHTIDLAITSSLDAQITLDVILDQVMAELKPDAAVIYTYHAGLDRLQLTASRGMNSPLSGSISPALGEGPAGRSAVERQIISQLDLALAEKQDRDILESYFPGAGACFSAPLIVKGQIKGVLQLLFRGPFQPPPAWMDFLKTMTTQTAIALESAVLFHQLQAAVDELNLAYDATMEGWARALELRSQEERGHAERVTRLAVDLAVRLGLSAAELTDYRRGVLMHDIGKMAVPEKILLKPSRLKPEEMDLVRQHPLMARDLLARIPSLQRALQVPLYHHERWDGSGYPEGLKRDEIPYPARIYAVIDVWDALVSDQPYRKAWTEPDALAYIQENSGILFDPQVVDAFLELQAEKKNK